jgi:hypothetical protein
MPASTARSCASGGYELGWEPDLPRAVVIDEAVELARQYSTKDSGRFVQRAAQPHGRGAATGGRGRTGSA